MASVEDWIKDMNAQNDDKMSCMTERPGYDELGEPEFHDSQSELKDRDSDGESNHPGISFGFSQLPSDLNTKDDEVCSVMTTVSRINRRRVTTNFVDNLRNEAITILGDEYSLAQLLHFCASFLSTLQQMPTAEMNNDVLVDKGTAYVFPRQSSMMMKVYLLMSHVNGKQLANYNYIRQLLADETIGEHGIERFLTCTDFPEERITDEDMTKIVGLVRLYTGNGVDDRSKFKDCASLLKNFQSVDYNVPVVIGKNELGLPADDNEPVVYLISSNSQLNLLRALVEDKDAFIAVPCTLPCLFMDVYEELYTMSKHSLGDYAPLAQKGYFCVKAVLSDLPRQRDIGSAFARLNRKVQECNGPNKFSLARTELIACSKVDIPVKAKKTQTKPKSGKIACKSSPKAATVVSKQESSDVNILHVSGKALDKKVFTNGGYKMTTTFAKRVEKTLQCIVDGGATINSIEANMVASYSTHKAARNRYATLLKPDSTGESLVYRLDLNKLPVTWMKGDEERHITGLLFYVATQTGRSTTVDGSELRSAAVAS